MPELLPQALGHSLQHCSQAPSCWGMAKDRVCCEGSVLRLPRRVGGRSQKGLSPVLLRGEALPRHSLPVLAPPLPPPGGLLPLLGDPKQLGLEAQQEAQWSRAACCLGGTVL